MIGVDFSDSNIAFRHKLFDEIIDKYLNQDQYDSIMVIAGVRIKIEELVHNRLDADDTEEFFAQHKVINKLDYAKSTGIDIPELYYLLQPLYNVGMHLKGDDNVVKSKIKSCYLKTDNLHIRKMI